FAAILVLFFWLFARILMHLRANETPKNGHLQWMTVGVAAAMLAAMAQGMGDSAFLEQDLAFCFWVLVVTLLVLRVLCVTPLRKAKAGRLTFIIVPLTLLFLSSLLIPRSSPLRSCLVHTLSSIRSSHAIR